MASPVMMRARWAKRRGRPPMPRGVLRNPWVLRTANHYGISVSELCARRRFRPLVRRRWVAMYLLWQDGLSTPAIAAQLNLSNHTTILHGIGQIGECPDLLAAAGAIRRAYVREQRVAEGARA